MQDDVAVVKLLIRHPMETGRRRDRTTGQKITRHYIRELRCEHNGEQVLTADLSWGVSANPYLSFRILDAKPGDELYVAWIDNRGQEDDVATTVV